MASSKHLTLPSSSPFPLKPHFSSSSAFYLLEPLLISIPTMKLARIIPGKLFKPKKSRSVSRSETDPSSFSSQTTSSSSSEDVFKKPGGGLATPTSVLPSGSAETSISAEEWSEISADVYLELKQAFEMIDRDGDGRVRREELEALLRGLGGGEPPSPEELRVMLAELDRDGDGCVTLEELCAVGSAFAPPACAAEVREAFEFFDSNGDGRITAEELHGVFKAIGDAQCTLEECRRMIRGADRNGDGFVCFEDFSLMMDRQLGR